jgi:transposase
MGDLSDFQIGQIFGARLDGASVNKTATLLGASRAAVPKVVTAYTDRGKTSSAGRQSGCKPKLSERRRRTLKRIVSNNSRTAAAKVTAVLPLLELLQQR